MKFSQIKKIQLISSGVGYNKEFGRFLKARKNKDWGDYTRSIRKKIETIY